MLADVRTPDLSAEDIEQAMQLARELLPELRAEVDDDGRRLLDDLTAAHDHGDTARVCYLLHYLHPIAQAVTGDVLGLGITAMRGYAMEIAHPCACPHDKHLLDINGCGGPRKAVFQDSEYKGVVMCFACWGAVHRPASMLVLADDGPHLLNAAKADQLYRDGTLTESQCRSIFNDRFTYDHEPEKENETP